MCYYTVIYLNDTNVLLQSSQMNKKILVQHGYVIFVLYLLKKQISDFSSYFYNVVSQIKWQFQNFPIHLRVWICRNLLGEDLDSLGIKELENLEKQLDSSLKHIRSTRVMHRTDYLGEFLIWYMTHVLKTLACTVVPFHQWHWLTWDPLTSMYCSQKESTVNKLSFF
jgi:hypothetical protein